MSKIYFTKNWNNKLDHPYFTTIRNYSNKEFNNCRNNIFNEYDIMLDKSVYTTARLIDFEIKQYMNIPYGLILIDTGLANKSAQFEVFNNFGMESSKSQMIILTFKNISNKGV